MRIVNGSFTFLWLLECLTLLLFIFAEAIKYESLTDLEHETSVKSAEDQLENVPNEKHLEFHTTKDDKKKKNNFLSYASIKKNNFSDSSVSKLASQDGFSESLEKSTISAFANIVPFEVFSNQFYQETQKKPNTKKNQNKELFSIIQNDNNRAFPKNMKQQVKAENKFKISKHNTPTNSSLVNHIVTNSQTNKETQQKEPKKQLKEASHQNIKKNIVYPMSYPYLQNIEKNIKQGKFPSIESLYEYIQDVNRDNIFELEVLERNIEKGTFSNVDAVVKSLEGNANIEHFPQFQIIRRNLHAGNLPSLYLLRQCVDIPITKTVIDLETISRNIETGIFQTIKSVSNALNSVNDIQNHPYLEILKTKIEAQEFKSLDSLFDYVESLFCSRISELDVLSKDIEAGIFVKIDAVRVMLKNIVNIERYPYLENVSDFIHAGLLNSLCSTSSYIETMTVSRMIDLQIISDKIKSGSFTSLEMVSGSLEQISDLKNYPYLLEIQKKIQSGDFPSLKFLDDYIHALQFNMNMDFKMLSRNIKNGTFSNIESVLNALKDTFDIDRNPHLDRLQKEIEDGKFSTFRSLKDHIKTMAKRNIFDIDLISRNIENGVFSDIESVASALNTNICVDLDPSLRNLQKHFHEGQFFTLDSLYRYIEKSKWNKLAELETISRNIEAKIFPTIESVFKALNSVKNIRRYPYFQEIRKKTQGGFFATVESLQAYVHSLEAEKDNSMRFISQNIEMGVFPNIDSVFNGLRNIVNIQRYPYFHSILKSIEKGAFPTVHALYEKVRSRKISTMNDLDVISINIETGLFPNVESVSDAIEKMMHINCHPLLQLIQQSIQAEYFPSENKLEYIQKIIKNQLKLIPSSIEKNVLPTSDKKIMKDATDNEWIVSKHIDRNENVPTQKHDQITMNITVNSSNENTARIPNIYFHENAYDHAGKLTVNTVLRYSKIFHENGSKKFPKNLYAILTRREQQKHVEKNNDVVIKIEDQKEMNERTDNLPKEIIQEKFSAKKAIPEDRSSNYLKEKEAKINYMGNNNSSEKIQDQNDIINFQKIHNDFLRKYITGTTTEHLHTNFVRTQLPNVATCFPSHANLVHLLKRKTDPQHEFCRIFLNPENKDALEKRAHADAKVSTRNENLFEESLSETVRTVSSARSRRLQIEHSEKESYSSNQNSSSRTKVFEMGIYALYNYHLIHQLLHTHKIIAPI